MAVSILGNVTCAICGVRKARRSCPGVKGEICSICCGTEREQSIDCPLDCEHLRLAHEHESKTEQPKGDLPDPDIDVDEDFLGKYEWVLIVLGSSLIDAWNEAPASTDYDAAEALGSLVQTFRAGRSGLIVEEALVNPYAARMAEAYRARVAEIQKRLADSGETGYLTEEAVLKITAFLRRLAILDNNGRKYSRAFLDILNRSYAGKPKPEDSEISGSDDEPRIIL